MFHTEMNKFKNDFDIPIDVKNDLVYCQRALANHISIHQQILTNLESLVPSDQKQKYLRQIEKEIISIGSEQKNLFNRLRLFTDHFIISNKTASNVPDRKSVTNFVAEDIRSYIGTCGENEVEPISVLPRLDQTELLNKYIFNVPTTDVNGIVTIKDSDNEDDDYAYDVGYNDNTFNVNNETQRNGGVGEVMEVLVSPEDITESLQAVYQQPYYQNHQPFSKQTKQESLLKPKAERLSAPKQEKKPVVKVVPEPVEQKISLSRLKLKEALSKAKDEKNNKLAGAVAPAPLVNKPHKAKSESPETFSSSSQSSNSSSDDLFDTIGLTDENEPVVMGKEAFLRMFGLYTHNFSSYLLKRRSARKRRNCTSTERVDFHYGRFDLFERQYAHKRNKQQFLYSPPATRAKRQRRVESNGETAPSTSVTTTSTVVTAKNQNVAAAGNGNRSKAGKSNAASTSTTQVPAASSTASSRSARNSKVEKVCLTCFKKNNLLKCKICMGTYHLNCHTAAFREQAAKDQICPYCARQQSRKGWKEINGPRWETTELKKKRKEFTSAVSKSNNLWELIVLE